MPDEARSPLDRFLDAFWKDAEQDAVRPLADYLARFPGDDAGITREYRALVGRGATSVRGGPSGASGRLGNAPDGGSHIGPYRILRAIGRGGQGDVYVAEDERLHRTVALKVLTSRSALSSQGLVRFRREAEIASKLDHPGICPVYDVGLEGDVPFIAMKLVEGETLAKRITTAQEGGGDDSTHVVLPATGEEPPSSPGDASRNAPKTQAEIFRIVRLFEQAARALHAAHEAGVIHRDIKPGNMMVTPEGEPVILDFGLAQDTESDAPSLTGTGELMGTPHYMSPEQIAAHRIRLDRRTDVWSLGVSLFECLTLTRPFDAPTRDGIYQAIIGRDPPDPRSLNAAVPSDLKVVIETALDKDRNRRYATALDLAEDLRRIAAHEPILAKPVGPMTRLWRWCQRNPALAAALVGLFVVLAAGLTIALVLLDETRRERDATGRERDRADKNAAARTVERDAKQTALGEKTAALNDYDRLGDVSRLDQLTREADLLWPADPDKASAMTAWVGRADGLAANLPGHREVVAKLRTTALPYSDADKAADLAAHAAEQAKRAEVVEQRTKLAASLKTAESRAASRPAAESSSRPASQPAEDSPAEIRAAMAKADAELRALDAKIAERLTWRFENQPDQFKHDTLAKLAADLAACLDADPHKGVFASVKARLAFAESVRRETIERHEAKWKEAVASIADRAQCPKYGGLKIVPQLGLVPIGKDPQSGLWEFAHLQTTAPGVDPVPERGTNGRLVVKEATGIVFVLIPGGTFQMGAIRPDEEHDAGEANVDPGAQNNEGPVHAVRLAPFFLSKYEMTQGQWLRIVGENPSQFPPGTTYEGKTVDLRNPVEQVSYGDCDQWLGRLGLLMPTEAQWEYAARGGTATPWWCGDKKESLAKAANIADAAAKRVQPQWGAFESWDDGYGIHAPVGSFLPNAFGLHDVLGNVWEWCRDWYGDYEEPVADGDGLRKASARRLRVFRGGSFGLGASSARSAFRFNCSPEIRDGYLGVRPARGVSRLDNFTTSPTGR